MLAFPTKYILYIFIIALGVVSCGFGAVLVLLSETAVQTYGGYALCAFGAGLAILTIVFAVKAWTASEDASSPTAQAERVIETRQRKRHVQATEYFISDGFPSENSVTARQDARAKRIRDAHRRRK